MSDSTVHTRFMQRCLQLAALGEGRVAPNPMVGSVLVYNDRIIGEGWHKNYGEAHAEVNCIDSVAEEDREYVKKARLYVSLEPCAHTGKTPPCTDRIIREGIPEVFIGTKDPFSLVNGKGIEKLQQAGVKVTYDILGVECREQNRRFFTFHSFKRPYIILKWAQTADGYIGRKAERLIISNAITNRLVHRWRSVEQAIMIGTATALDDDPMLTTRFWPGKSPLRLVIDRNLQLAPSLKIFNDDAPTLIYHTKSRVYTDDEARNEFQQIEEGADYLQVILEDLYHRGVQSVMVEGGARLLQSFIDAELWDECRVITAEKLFLHDREGIRSPKLSHAHLLSTEQIMDDRIDYFRNEKYFQQTGGEGEK